MRYLYILLALVYITQSHAQTSNIVGQVINKDSVAIEGVAIILQKQDSTFIAGTITDKEGRFTLPMTEKPYRLMFQHLAYEAMCLNSSKEQIGNIILKESDCKLDEVIVKAERPVIRMINNRLTYDLQSVKQNKIIANAHELLKELPSISSTDGNSLNLAGANGTTILISGKVSSLSTEQLIEYLKTLPAEKVEKVEVIYNAPPQLHIKGAVINVVLKKENRYTMNGQVQATWINQHENSFSGVGSLFLTSPKWSLDLMYSIADNKQISKSTTTAKHTLGNDIYDIDSENHTKSTSNKHNVYTNIAYNLDDTHSLELSYNGLYAPRNKSDAYSVNNLFSDANSLNKGKDYLHNASLYYKHKWGNISVEYTNYTDDNTQNMKYIKDHHSIDAFTYQRKQNIDRVKAYADMSHNLKNNWILNYGASYNYVKNNNKQSNVDKQHDNEGSYTSAFATEEHTGNIYAGTQKSFYEGKLSIDCSLIGELYKINSYRKNALLPNITVTFIPANDHIFQLAYNSIRSYPSYWQRQNYTSYNDEYSVSMGNPLLKPARTGNTNLTYVLKNKYTFQVSYYKVEDFFIDQSYQSPEKLQLLHKTFNIDYTSLLNFTAVIPISFGNIVSSNLIANVYNERYKSNEWFELAYNRNKWTGSLMAYNTIFISKKPNITMNLMAFYRTPCIQGIWDLEDNWCINTGLRYTFAKDKAIVGLQCNDIFESLYPKVKVRFDKQYQNLNQNFYQRNITLSFTYKFNGFKDRTPKEVDTSRYGVN